MKPLTIKILITGLIFIIGILLIKTVGFKEYLSLSATSVLNNTGKNVLNIPQVLGDGENDDTQGIQSLLDRKVSTVYLPAPPKCYLLSKTLRIYSGQTLIADCNTVIRLADSAMVHMITNADHINGDSMITINGGIWDGNNEAQTTEYQETRNWRIPFNPDRYLGVLMQFNNVTDLRIANLTLKNPQTFGIQTGNIFRFTFENITFDYNLKKTNMDGIHFQGNCCQGRIENIKGNTNDDMIALNADGASIFEMSRGPITDIQIDGIWSDYGYCAIRLLSAGSPIKNIKITNIFGTFRYEIIKLSNHKVHPGSESTFENISIDGIFSSGLGKSKRKSQIWIESPAAVRNLSINNYHLVGELFPSNGILIDSGVYIDNFSLGDISLVNQSENPVNFLNNRGIINNLNLTNIFLNGSEGNGGGQLIKNSGSINLINRNNVSVKGFRD